MVQLTEFGISVKRRLIDLGQTQKWLIESVREKTGNYIDSGYLQRLMTGKAKSANMKTAICEILDIKEENA